LAFQRQSPTLSLRAQAQAFVMKEFSRRERVVKLDDINIARAHSGILVCS
jgi:hypothetical protein